MPTDAPHPSRRTVLTTAAAGLTATTALALLTHATEPARAEVDAEWIADAEYRADEATPIPWIKAGGTFEYKVTSPVDRWEVTIEVSPPNPESFQVIASESGSTTAQEFSGAFEISGDVTDHPSLDQQTYRAPDGETITRDLSVRARIAVYNGSEVVVSDSVARTVTLTITDDVVESDASLTVSGEVLFQADADAPEPA